MVNNPSRKRLDEEQSVRNEEWEEEDGGQRENWLYKSQWVSMRSKCLNQNTTGNLYLNNFSHGEIIQDLISYQFPPDSVYKSLKVQGKYGFQCGAAAAVSCHTVALVAMQMMYVQPHFQHNI